MSDSLRPGDLTVDDRTGEIQVISDDGIPTSPLPLLAAEKFRMVAVDRLATVGQLVRREAADMLAAGRVRAATALDELANVIDPPTIDTGDLFVTIVAGEETFTPTKAQIDSIRADVEAGTGSVLLRVGMYAILDDIDAQLAEGREFKS